MPLHAGETQAPSLGGAAHAGGHDVALEVAAGGAAAQEGGAARGTLLPDLPAPRRGVNNQGAPCPETPLSGSPAAVAPGTTFGPLAILGVPVSTMRAVGTTVGTAGTPASTSTLGTAGTGGTTVGLLGRTGRPASTVGMAGTTVGTAGAPASASTVITAGAPLSVVSTVGTSSSTVSAGGTTVDLLGTAATPTSVYTVITGGKTLSVGSTVGTSSSTVSTGGTTVGLLGRTGRPASAVGTAGTTVGPLGTAGTPASTVITAGKPLSIGSTAGTPSSIVSTDGTTVSPLGTVSRPASTVGTAGTSVSIVCTAGTPMTTAGTPSTAVCAVGTPVYINLQTSGVSSTLSSTGTAAPKVVISAGRLGSELPTAIGTRSSPAALPPKAAGQGGVGSASAPQVAVTRVTAISQVPGKETVITLPRASTLPASGGQRGAQGTSVQLPANFQIPQGMMLIRSESGQLMLVSQQALAQAQAQGIIPRAAGTANGSVARVTAPQGSAAAVCRKPDATAAVRVPPLPSSTPATSFQKVSVLKTTGGAVSTAAGQTVRPAVPPQSAAPLVIPIKTEGPKATPVATISAETLENVKKCKNFLVTLIKLASSGTHSAEMAKNVKELVKSLLDGKIEPEEFTDRLYMELKSSPQPYLVPFLKRSLPAVRQLTPNSQLFIQQCAPLPSSAKPAVVPATMPPVTGTTAGKSLQANAGIDHPVKATQAARPTQLVIQQPRGVVIKQSAVPASVQNKAVTKQLVTALQTTSHPAGVAVKQSPLQVSRIISLQPPQVQKNPFKDIASASFRDEDDINDVASMAGVNLSEENARILATNSEHVGTIVRSCRDDPFLSVAALQKRIMEIGKRHGIADVSTDAASLVSYATQERLRELVEKMTVVAQHRNASYKDDLTHRQTTDTRSQLRFLEQLDRLERRRKEEEEREALLRIAKSRSNREDPELLRLKQKAKEMQQLELAQTQQRDANLTALAAIGPRKKRPLESLGYGSGNEAPGALVSSASSVAKQPSVRRVTRVSLRDLVFCMEQDPALRHSLCLYRALIR